MHPLAALAFFPKLTNRRFLKLAAYFSDLNKIWQAEFEELARAGLEQEIIHEFIVWREQKPLEYFQKILEAEGVWTVSLPEPNYPKLLKEISDPPHTLFIRGTLPDFTSPALAVVGTRKSSEYGRRACEELVGPLARNKIIIVSGLALGIDGIAHNAAIEAGGLTVAVLGSGVDRSHVYPAAHRTLSEKIIGSGGALISEYPPGSEPTPYTFPERNRIIAGLSLGTLVVEAPEESGALITARVALDYNREVMAVPQPITSPYGAGANNLIKMGARVVTKPEDVIEHLNLASLVEETSKKTMPAMTREEGVIYAALSHEPKHLDIIIKETGLNSQNVGSAITMMEIKGIAKNLGGMCFIKR